MVSGTRALLFVFGSYMEGSKAADPKGTKSCRTQVKQRRPQLVLGMVTAQEGRISELDVA